MTIALTGGTGFVGRTLIERALAKKLELRALARSEQVPCNGVAWVRGNLADRDALDRLVSGAEAVIHVAGVVNAPDAAAFEAGNVAGTLNLIEACVAAGIPRFIHVSSLAARQPNLSAYGASKARAERLVTASGLDWSIVRPPAIYGPRDREMFELFRAAKWGVVPLPPPGRLSVIHVDDLADLLLALLSGGEAVTRRTFEPDDGRSDGWSNAELARAIGMAQGRRPWVPHLSRETLNQAARLDRLFRRGNAKLTPDRVSYMTHPDWVVSRGARPPSELWRPRIPTREGLKTTVEWYRAEGWL